MRKSHLGVQTDLEKRKEKEILEKGPDVSVTIYRGEINLYVSFRIMRCIMSTSCVVVRFSRDSLAILCVAILDDLSLDRRYSAVIGTDCRHWY
jgi:hypothetical protein